MTAPIWTSARDAALKEAWESDAATEHMPLIMEAATGHAFSLKAITVHAAKLGFRRPESDPRDKGGRPRGSVQAVRSLPDPGRYPEQRTRLVRPGTYPAPASGFTMIGRAR